MITRKLYKSSLLCNHGNYTLFLYPKFLYISCISEKMLFFNYSQLNLFKFRAKTYNFELYIILFIILNSDVIVSLLLILTNDLKMYLIYVDDI